MKLFPKIALCIATIFVCIIVVGLFIGYQVDITSTTGNKYSIKTSFGWSYDAPQATSCQAINRYDTGFPFVHTNSGCGGGGANITAFILDVLSGLLLVAGFIGVCWLIYHCLFRNLQNQVRL